MLVLERGMPVGKTAGVKSASAIRPRIVLLALILAHLALTLSAAAWLNVWLDEGHSLRTSGQDLTWALRRALHYEMQPPFYFVLLTLWRKIHASILMARLLSCLCTTLTLLVAWRIAKGIFRVKSPAWIVALLAFHPLVVWAGAEIRLYALALLLSSLLLLTFFEGYMTDRPRRWVRPAHFALAVAGFYTQYYFGALLLGMALALAVTRRWRALGGYVIYLAILGLCSGPLLLHLPDQLTNHTYTVSAVLSPLKQVVFLGRRLVYFMLPLSDLQVNGLRWLEPPFLLLLALIVLASRRRIKAQHLAIWTITAYLTLFFVGVINITGHEVMRAKHTIVLFLPALFSFVCIVEFVTDRARNRLFPLLMSLVLIVNGAALAVFNRPLAKQGDFIRITKYLKQHERPGQPILVFVSEVEYPFSLYYRGPNPVAPLPRPADDYRYDLLGEVIRSESDITRVLNGVAGNPDTVWLISDRGINDDEYMCVKFNYALLQDYIDTHYRVLDDKFFYGARLRLLRRHATP